MKPLEIDQLFDLLDKWRLFPDYQLERRVDIFFAIYLPQILEKQLNNQPILKIIPEFPVRKGVIDSDVSDNRSFKIDYLVISEKKVLLVELKTDISSITDNQCDNYKKAKKANVKALIDGLIAIFEATKSKVKYRRLMEEFKEIGWLQSDGKTWQNTSDDKAIEIVYIQPTDEKKCDDVTVISFKEVATIIEKNDSELSKRFAKSLRNWVKSENEKSQPKNI